jgi:hypothetical protein
MDHAGGIHHQPLGDVGFLTKRKDDIIDDATRNPIGADISHRNGKLRYSAASVMVLNGNDLTAI